MPRVLVYLRRIADALDRLAPPTRRPTRRAEFSIATRESFEAGYDGRGQED
jgi:hypothetical protein